MQVLTNFLANLQCTNTLDNLLRKLNNCIRNKVTDKDRVSKVKERFFLIAMKGKK